LLELGDLVRGGLERNCAIEIGHVAGVGRRVGCARRRASSTAPPTLGQQRGGAHEEDNLTEQH
jgi:hypothetical protein